MPDYSPRQHSRLRATSLLGSVSLLAVMVAGGPSNAANMRTTAGFVPPTAAVVAAQQAATAQATAAAQTARTSLINAANALKAQIALQAAAAKLGSKLSVPDGVTTGGLMPSGGKTTDPNAGLTANPTLWQGANTLPKPPADGSDPNCTAAGCVINILQTQQKAILTWDSFNVGTNTTVNFDQQATNWTVLNRITSGNPTYILGHINTVLVDAKGNVIIDPTTKQPEVGGGVYIINQNGIIFGAGSQLNMHALVASDLDVGSPGMSISDRNNVFLNAGIGSAAPTFSVNDPSNNSVPLQTPDPVTHLANLDKSRLGHGIEVDQGASINTSVIAPDSPGWVYLFGVNVTNHGAISSPAGEVAMVAGASTITLTPGSYDAAAIPTSVLPSGVKFRGTGFRIQNYASQYIVSANNQLQALGGTFTSGTGNITYDGLIQTPRGILVMNGDQINILGPSMGPAGANPGGLISADTSITRNSMVLLDAATSVSMNGIISIQPDDNGETLPLLSGSSASNTGSSVQSFTPAFVEISGQTNVDLASNAFISAPSATVSINAATNGAKLSGGSFTNIGTSDTTDPQRVLLESGSLIDVAGLQDVELPATYNFISFQPRGNEFADMPLQRNGPLFGQTLWIDIRASGTRSDGTTWEGTPLADANGFVDAVGRSIEQLMTTGGNVSLRTDLTPPTGTVQPSVVIAKGATINMAGGNITYLPGNVPITILEGTNHQLYDMADADPNITYLGIAGQFTTVHQQAGVTNTSNSQAQMPEQGYSEGHDAGGLSITSANPVLGGTLLFGSVAGERQIQAGIAPSANGGIVPTQANSNQLPSQGYLQLVTPTSVVIGNGGASSTSYVSNAGNQTTLSADQLSSYGLSGISITSNDLTVASGSTLRLANGGNFSATTAGAIDISGNVTTAGGQVNLRTDFFDLITQNGPLANTIAKGVTTADGHNDIFVEGTIDVSGVWVNDTGRFGADASSPEPIGPGFINGGSISIATNIANGNNSASDDGTGNILLASTALLDASSGGYVSPSGAVKTVAPGVVAGKGGSVALLLYQGAKFVPPNGGVGPTNPVGKSTVAQIEFGGTIEEALRAYGFQSNGTLTLAAPKVIQIGGVAPAPDSIGTSNTEVGLYLSADLFNKGGFSGYNIESAPDGYSVVHQLGGGQAASPDGITVAAGVSLTLQQTNLAITPDLLALSTGTNIAARATDLMKAGARPAPLQTLPEAQRTPVNLAFQADNILLDNGSRIITDPKAQIVLAGAPDNTQANLAIRVPQPGNNNVLLLGSILDNGGSLQIKGSQVWLGPQATIDLSGTFISDPLFGLPGGPVVSGTLVSGGTFTVDAGQAPSAGSYLVAQSGAKVDVSGVDGTVQVQNSATQAPTSLSEWSDAGTVSVNTGALAWGGEYLTAHDPRANGATLFLGGGQISLQQTSTDPLNNVVGALAQAATPSTAIPGLSGSLPAFSKLGLPAVGILAAVDKLSAFDNVFLYSGTASGGPGSLFTDINENTFGVTPPSLTTLSILGNVNWHVADRLQIAASLIQSVTPGSTSFLAAPYADLTGGRGLVTGGSSTITVGAYETTAGQIQSVQTIAQTIDIESAAFAGFNGVTFTSLADIRLSTPKVANGQTTTSSVSSDTSNFVGSLTAAGDLTLDAERIYPVSAVDFTIQTGGTVTFAKPAGSSPPETPLSAGGVINVSAATINQDGNLFAPLGTIDLGDTGTQNVTLGAGSITSVSLASVSPGGADTVVPYGQTEDGTNWYYNAILNPLTLPPGKGVTLLGQHVNDAAGSTIDVRGGGDLQAMEFVAGKGGSRDTLNTTPSGQTVYALLPANDPVAAFDVNFTAAHSANTPGDVYPLAGTQITIAGGGGIPAGTYTLYPAHYATLPGAMRVLVDGSALGSNIPSGTKQPDGTVLVTGHFTSSIDPQLQSAGSTLFSIQPNAVWQQYSQYTFSSANTYFANLAKQNNTAAPQLPMDAGQLSIVARPTPVIPCDPSPGVCTPTTAASTIALDGTAQTDAAAGGRGSELDISADNLALVSDNNAVSYPPSENWVTVSVDQINNFGFESVLLGGIRADQSNGTLITPTANAVAIDNSGGTPLKVPELLIVTQPTVEFQLVQASNGTQTVVLPIEAPIPPAPGHPLPGSITIAQGSDIEATGKLDVGLGRHYFFSELSAANVATLLGGTLSADGTTITGVPPTNLPIAVAGGLQLAGCPNGVCSFNLADPTAVKNLETALLNSAARNAIFYSVGLGAMFLATSDSTFSITPPPTAPKLTIEFQGQPSSVQLVLPGRTVGSVNIAPSATINTPILSIQGMSTATMTSATTAPAISIDSSATLSVQQLNLAAPTIGIGTDATGSLVLSSDNLNKLSNLQGLTLTLKANSIAFGTNVNFDLNSFDQAGSTSRAAGVVLDAAAISNTGGGDASITIGGATGGTITVLNSSGIAPTAPQSGVSGSLTLTANEIDLGGGTQTIAGFGTVSMNASTQVFVAAPGALTFGSSSDQIAVNVTTPNILVGTATGNTSGAQFLLTTLGMVTVAGGSSTLPSASSQIGGNFAITAGSVQDSGTIQAKGGTVTLEATGGDITLTGAVIEGGGFEKTLVDSETFVPGGKVVLQADAGNVTLDAASTIDVAQPANGLGYGGSVTIKATQASNAIPGTQGNAVVLGTIDAQGGPGLGGSFTLDIQGQANLDQLANLLSASQLNPRQGVTGAIGIHTRSGNLVLSADKTLTANQVTLTADDQSAGNGAIDIAGKIDARGYAGTDGTEVAGGQVALFAANGFTLESGATIDASYSGHTVSLPLGTNYNVKSGAPIDFGASTAGDVVTFSQSGTYTNGTQVTTFAADQSLVLAANSSVALDADGTMTFKTEATGAGAASPLNFTYLPERGGDVTVGIGTNATNTNKTIATGVIDLKTGSTINVSGGTKGGLSGGTLTLIAPLVAQSGTTKVDDVAIASIDSSVGGTGLDANISGARSVTVQAFVTFSTDPNATGRIIAGNNLGAGNGVWDGIIDPAGNYADDKNGGGAVASGTNQDHINFYTVALENFVQSNYKFTDGNGRTYGFNTAVNRFQSVATSLAQEGTSFELQPGVQLINPL